MKIIYLLSAILLGMQFPCKSQDSDILRNYIQQYLEHSSYLSEGQLQVEKSLLDVKVARSYLGPS
ncbi:MAG: hypothetical protein AAFO69_12105, partial [Bacteroidota bacterium]